MKVDHVLHVIEIETPLLSPHSPSSSTPVIMSTDVAVELVRGERRVQVMVIEVFVRRSRHLIKPWFPHHWAWPGSRAGRWHAMWIKRRRRHCPIMGGVEQAIIMIPTIMYYSGETQHILLSV